MNNLRFSTAAGRKHDVEFAIAACATEFWRCGSRLPASSATALLVAHRNHRGRWYGWSRERAIRAPCCW